MIHGVWHIQGVLEIALGGVRRLEIGVKKIRITCTTRPFQRPRRLLCHMTGRGVYYALLSSVQPGFEMALKVWEDLTVSSFVLVCQPSYMV
jgi:hypothetical protein